MSHTEGPRELGIDQSHIGTLLGAGMLALVVSCLAATMIMTLAWSVATWSGWVFCLLLPAVSGAMILAFLVMQWGERNLSRLWPSGRRLVLEQAFLTLKRRNAVQIQVVWDEPLDVVRWRMRRTNSTQPSDSFFVPLCLACQLSQKGRTISVYTHCSPQDWRRVPGWKNFPPLFGKRKPDQSLRLPGHLTSSVMSPARAPSHRGYSSLSEGDAKVLWPAERYRRRRGWELTFEDFCALMATVEHYMEKQEQHD
jgi:hypothetical protein